MEISELAKQINNLTETVKLIDSNVKFNLQVTWSVLAFVVATAGAALYFMVKVMVDKKVEDQLDKRLEALKDMVKIETIEHIYEHPQFLIFKLDPPVTRFKTLEIQLTNYDHINPDFSLDYIDRFKVFSPISERYLLFDVRVKDDSFTFWLKDYDKEKDGDRLFCTIMLLNKNYVRDRLPKK